MIMDHYEFLAKLYEITKPRVYLEIGVQAGKSLELALPHAGKIAGVDIDTSNAMHVGGLRVGLYECTSYDFFHVHVPDFVNPETDESELDLVLIDGSHLIEDVWQDFLGAETLAGPRTIICFDDVLPRNNYEATREAHEGAWAGDTWKIWGLLQERRPTMEMHLVDVQPCGKLIVFPNSLDPRMPPEREIAWDVICDYMPVPNEILTRADAIDPEEAFSMVRAWLEQAS